MSETATEESLLITTTHGQLLGQRCVSVYNDLYNSFERIPFAEPPIGDLRFCSPRPLKPWKGVLDCRHAAPVPPQINMFSGKYEGTEDCLYLNIYVKKLQSYKPLPVMAYIFGGGFQNGGATRDMYGADYFMQQEVILVTISYRLGALGFLSLKDPSLCVPGNSALKDQLLALKWLQNNICHFNGDASNITLFGESAGAAVVHALMLSPRAEGLFHKAILQSGVMLSPWAEMTIEEAAYRLAAANGYQGVVEDEAAILQYLRSLPAEDLVRHDLLSRLERMNNFYVFVPVVEPYESEDCVLSQQPRHSINTAWGNKIPLLIGGTSFEGLVMYSRIKKRPHMLTDLNEQNLELLLPKTLAHTYDYTLEKQQALGAKLMQLHFCNKPFALEQIMEYCELSSYKGFWHPIWRYLRARLDSCNAADTYLYRFDFDSPTFNHYRIRTCGPDVRGVCHADDLSYLFFSKFSWKLEAQSAEYKTIQRMINIWTTFALTSNPNCESTFMYDWQKLETENLHDGSQKPQCLNISAELQLIDLPESKKLKVWDELYLDE